MLAGAFLIDLMTHGTMGISKACSIGNKMDIHECDILEYFLDDPKTGVIGLYLESIVDGPRFIELCRRSTKPIVVLKGGKSAKGAEAALSHTASMAGNDAVVSGAFRQAGVIEADDFYQMTDLCRTLGAFSDSVSSKADKTTSLESTANKTSSTDNKLPTEKGLSGKNQGNSQNRIAIMTYSGGAGIVSTDFLESQNMELAELSPETLEDASAPLSPLDAPGQPHGSLARHHREWGNQGVQRIHSRCL
jgi:acyl-CoA synthetase (NDP forming)